MRELKSYKINDKNYGGEYILCLDSIVSWIDGTIMYYVIVKTPENCFGYEDYIHIRINYKREYEIYTSYRYLPQWIQKRLGKALIRYQGIINSKEFANEDEVIKALGF